MEVDGVRFEVQMNVLLLGYDKGTGKYPYYFGEELKKLNTSVMYYFYDHDRNRIYIEKLPLKQERRNRINAINISYKIHSAITKHGVDILIIFGSNYFLFPSALKTIKRRGVKIVLWEGNLNFGEKFQLDSIPCYDLIITGDSYILPFLKNILGHKNAHYLKGFGMPAMFKPKPLRGERKEKYGADISFIGKCFPNRARFFESLDCDVKIWGTNWTESALKKKDEIQTLDPAEKPYVFSNSKINLNLSAGNQQINNFSTRIFEIPFCDGFVLSEWTRDLVDLFEENKEIVVFKTPSEARDKIKYFLERGDERREIIERQKKKIMNNYLMTHTAEKALDLFKAL